MVEQGLKAVIYPELDEQGLQNFVKQLQEQIGGAFVNMGVNATDTQTSTASGNGNTGDTGGVAGSAGTTSEPPSESNPLPVEIVNKNDNKENEDTENAVKEGMKKADKETTEQHPELNEKKTDGLKKGIASVFGGLTTIGTSLMAGGTSVVDYVKKLWDFIEGSSPALKTVMDLFNTAFQMIWMPVGTIIAKELMPVLSGVMKDVSSWMNRAWEIYEKEGWSGLIKEALKVSLEVIWDYLVGMVDVLSPILVDLGVDIINAIGKILFGEDFSLKDILDKLKEVLDRAGEILQGLEPLNPIKNVTKSIEGLIESLTHPLDSVKEFVEDPVKTIGKQSTSIVSGFNPTNPASIITSLISGKNILPFADGGIVTKPTISLTGEAGPEAIVPLNQLSEVMNQYNSSSSSIGGNITGGNVMNFYITGNNPMEIGDEVQRILGKTVGKSSSKMMWW